MFYAPLGRIVSVSVDHTPIPTNPFHNGNSNERTAIDVLDVHMLRYEKINSQPDRAWATKSMESEYRNSGVDSAAADLTAVRSDDRGMLDGT